MPSSYLLLFFNLDNGLSVERTKWSDDILIAVLFENMFPLSLRETEHLSLARVLCGREEKLLMVGKSLQVLDLLLAVEHLPALDAENLAVRLGLYHLKFGDEVAPFA